MSRWNFGVLPVHVQPAQHSWLKRWSLPPLSCVFTVVRISWLFLCGSVSVLFLLLLTDLLVCLLLILHCFNYCSIMVIPSLKYSDVSHPFIFTIILAVPVPLLFHKHFRIIMFMSIKNSLDDLRE